MLQIYTTPNCSSCRKVKSYFAKHNISYTEKNIFSIPLTRDDVFKMLSYSENGFEDIISTRSKIIKEEHVNLEKMKTSELIDYIIAHPSILKRPIILSDEDMQIGYNDDDITLFLPEELREIECENCFKNDKCDFIEAIKKMKE